MGLNRWAELLCLPTHCFCVSASSTAQQRFQLISASIKPLFWKVQFYPRHYHHHRRRRRRRCERSDKIKVHSRPRNGPSVRPSVEAWTTDRCCRAARRSPARPPVCSRAHFRILPAVSQSARQAQCKKPAMTDDRDRDRPRSSGVSPSVMDWIDFRPSFAAAAAAAAWIITMQQIEITQGRRSRRPAACKIKNYHEVDEEKKEEEDCLHSMSPLANAMPWCLSPSDINTRHASYCLVPRTSRESRRFALDTEYLFYLNYVQYIVAVIGMAMMAVL